MQTASKVDIPGHRAPAVGLDSPFEMLQACHERVNQSLALMQRLQLYLREKGLDGDARQAARDVMRYFDMAAPLHHQDEELHVFPPLLQGLDASLHTVIHQLMDDHRVMETRWATARAALNRIAECDISDWTALTPEQTQALTGFASLYARHIADEEEVVSPAARACMAPTAVEGMSQDMMRRRGAS